MLSQEQLARAQGRVSVGAELHALCLQGRPLDETLLDAHERRLSGDVARITENGWRFSAAWGASRIPNCTTTWKASWNA